MKPSESFEGINSSLRQAFDSTIDFELPEIEEKKVSAPRVTISENVCISCEG